MARNKNQEEEKVLKEELGFDLDLNNEVPNVPLQEVHKINTKVQEEVNQPINYSNNVINCLRNERVIVRFLGRKNGIWGDNPKHVLAGGMSENAIRTFVVPLLSTGAFVNVLTNNEKEFLE